MRLIRYFFNKAIVASAPMYPDVPLMQYAIEEGTSK